MQRTASLAGVIAHYCTLSKRDVADLLRMTPEQVINDKRFTRAVDQFDVDHLLSTLPEAREVLQVHLPPITEQMTANYDMENNPMSAYTLGNWIVGFAERPEQMSMLLEIHNRLPAGIFADYLPDLLAIYTHMEHHGEDWQRAMAVISIPLVANYLS
jgi:hypothetical protein